MRILIVSQYFYPEGFKINDIANALIEKGHDIVVLTGLPNYPKGSFFSGYSFLKGPYRENINGIEIIRVPLIPRGPHKGIQLALNYLSFMFVATLLAPFVIKGKIDRIFVYQLSPVTAAFPAILLKWIKKAKVLFWVTDLWPETLKATGVVKSKFMLDLWAKFVKFLYHQSDLILVSSKGFINKIKQRGISEEKIIYWPQWAEDLFYQTEVHKKDLPYSEIPQGFIIMFAGNIGTSQAFETIVDAAEKLKDYKEIKWVILGDGLKKKWVEKEIRKRELEKSFFLLGRRPIERVPFYYALSNTLLASLNDDPLFSITVPAKIQSYLASGKPLIASMNGEGPDLIREAQAGLSCEANNSDALKDTILKLYHSSSEEQEKMGKSAQEFFLKNFKKSVLLDQLDKMLYSLTK